MKKYNITTLILMILVCLGPPLNLLFEYFVLHQNPSPVLWGYNDFLADRLTAFHHLLYKNIKVIMCLNMQL